MAKLTIGNQTVTVGDEFLRMTPEQQQATVDEIAASIGASAPPQEDALAAASRMSQFGPGTTIAGAPALPAPQPSRPDLMGATAATLGGIVNSIPVIGPMAQTVSDNLVGVGAQLTGGNYQDARNAAVSRRQELAAANPVASIAGNIGGGLAAFGAAGATSAGANALGLAGNLGQQMVNSGLSTLGLTTADNIVRGKAPTQALSDAILPSSIATAIPAVGAAINRGVDAVADAATRANQGRLTNAAIQNAPDAATLRSEASRLFDASTGGTPLAINDNAYFRFLGDVRQYANKLRINADNDPQSVGLLETLMRIADDTGSGVAVDLKDLHLVRQLARKVSGSPQGRDASFGMSVVDKMDDLIAGLKPTDILGGADPTQAANNLLNGISTWSRASKVGMLEEAVEKAGTYKSGMENGLRLQFQKILRDPKTRRLFTSAERQELERVANGTSLSNLVTLLGKFGFGTNGAGNMLGGTIGSLGAASVLGPVGGIAAALGASGARSLSENLGMNAANRATRAVATPNIPIAPRVQVPLPITQGIAGAGLLGRSALIGGE